MLMLLKCWMNALGLLKPAELCSLLKEAAFRAYCAAGKMFYLFKWVILADVVIFSLLGSKLLAVLQITKPEDIAALPPLVSVMSMVVGIIAFLVQGAFIIFLCDVQKGLPLKEYFSQQFFKYGQLILLFFFFLIVFLSFILSLGVTAIPVGHWILSFFARFLRLIVMFYWLESSARFKDFFTSCESGLNFILYNLSVILIFIGIIIAGKYGLIHLLAVLTKYRSGIEANVILKHLVPLVLRYTEFLVDFVLASFLYVVYLRRREHVYNKPLFDQ